MYKLNTRRMLLKGLSVLGAGFATGLHAQPVRFLEGTHYRALSENPLSRAQQASTLPLVTEVFWYGCPSCHAFDPLLEHWVRGQGENISFNRSPAAWDKNTNQHARLFYAARELGVLEQSHAGIFTEIHEKRNFLLDESSQSTFLQSQGIDPTTALKSLASFKVDSEVRKAEALSRELKVPSIPAMVVQGKYLVHLAGPVRNYQDMLEIVDFLLTQG